MIIDGWKIKKYVWVKYANEKEQNTVEKKGKCKQKLKKNRKWSEIEYEQRK